MIQKANESIIGEPKNIKKLRSEELLIELKTNLQASNLKKCTLLASILVTVSAHRTLNSCRGVISESDLQYVPETEILENLKDQSVTMFVESQCIKISKTSTLNLSRIPGMFS